MASSSVVPPGSRRRSWREIESLETGCDAADFLSGVEVWIKRPQVVNRRLLGAVLVEGDWDNLQEQQQRYSNSAKVPGDNSNCCIFVRQLLPRVKTISARRETVTLQCCGGEEYECVVKLLNCF